MPVTFCLEYYRDIHVWRNQLSCYSLSTRVHSQISVYGSVVISPSVCNIRVVFDRVTMSIELFVSSKT